MAHSSYLGRFLLSLSVPFRGFHALRSLDSIHEAYKSLVILKSTKVYSMAVDSASSFLVVSHTSELDSVISMTPTISPTSLIEELLLDTGTATS